MTNFEKLRTINTQTFNKGLYGWMMNLSYDDINNEQKALEFLNGEYYDFYENEFSLPDSYLKSIMEAFEDDMVNKTDDYKKGVKDLIEAITRYIS